jgi:hypothetical protein
MELTKRPLSEFNPEPHRIITIGEHKIITDGVTGWWITLKGAADVLGPFRSHQAAKFHLMEQATQAPAPDKKSASKG